MKKKIYWIQKFWTFWRFEVFEVFFNQESFFYEKWFFWDPLGPPLDLLGPPEWNKRSPEDLRNSQKKIQSPNLNLKIFKVPLLFQLHPPRNVTKFGITERKRNPYPKSESWKIFSEIGRPSLFDPYPTLTLTLNTKLCLSLLKDSITLTYKLTNLN